MKIAISSSCDESRNNLIKAFISQWPMYATPSTTIFENISWPEDENEAPALSELREKLNDVEQCLFAKMLLLERQYDEYKDVGYIVYNGSGADILVNALRLCEEGYVSEDFVERIIYHNKKLMKKLDVIYWLPNSTITEDSKVEDIQLENIYNNFYENYQTDFANSPFFDQQDCPSLLLLESSSPINEIKYLLDKNGNLEGTSQGGSDGDLLDTNRLKKALRHNPKLLEAALESLKNPQLVGSNPYLGSIII